MKIYNEKINIKTNKLKKNYTFCVLSDIHNTKGVSYKLWNKLLNEIELQKPSYIFIPGDIIYSADDILNKNVREKLEYLLVGLQAIAPVYISLGNHDLKAGKIASATDTLEYLKSLENDNMYILNNKTVNLEEITISGFSPRYESYYEKYKENWIKYFVEDFKKSKFNFNKNKYNVFLTHSPRIISKDETIELIRDVLEDIDLILCGHMHDGLVPRFIQNLGIIKSDKGIMVSEGDTIKDITFRKVDKCRGVYEVAGSKMIVTRGIRKWCQDNPLFNQVDKVCAKDFTTIKLIKKK